MKAGLLAFGTLIWAMPAAAAQTNAPDPLAPLPTAPANVPTIVTPRAQAPAAPVAAQPAPPPGPTVAVVPAGLGSRAARRMLGWRLWRDSGSLTAWLAVVGCGLLDAWSVAVDPDLPRY